MSPLSASTQRLQAVMNTLRYVQSNFQGIQDTYTTASKDASASATDMQSTKAPITACLGDKGDKSVAADGKKLVGLVNGTIVRLRNTEGVLQRSRQTSKDAGFPILGVSKELNEMLQASTDREVSKALQQSVGWLNNGLTYHQGADRSAGWSVDYAWQGENKLATVGNSLNTVAKDNDQGKNVSGDMAAAKPAIESGAGYVKQHAAAMSQALEYEGTAIYSLAQVQGWLAYALSQSQPKVAAAPPSIHLASLQDVLHANDPTP
ncbi:hypothetical protein JST97_00115 [bacterium]|nr:hypothetical protein [bacterium]